jgi:cell division protein FtsW
MVFNTTAAEVLDRGLTRSIYAAVIRQVAYAAVGGLGAIAIWWLGYEHVFRTSGILLGIGTTLLVLVFVPGIGQQINGAHRWIGIGGYSVQPSEFIKFLLPIYYIRAMQMLPKPIAVGEFLKVIGKMAVPLGLILIEPDNGTAAILLATLVVLCILTRIRWIYWALPLLVLCGGGAVAASQMPHVGDRIRIYLNPELDLQGKGHQPYQAKIAAGSGGMLGRGLGESLQKMSYLPEARSDYIAAIFAEEVGFVGMTVLIVLYMSIAALGFHIAASVEDEATSHMVAILVFSLSLQAFLNLGVVSGLLPSKGINLPFFSQGGSSLLANFAVVALVVNVAYRSREVSRA